MYSDKIELHTTPDWTDKPYSIHRDPLWKTVKKAKTLDDVWFYHCDHLGTPQEMTDQTGAIIWKAEYKAWGECKAEKAKSNFFENSEIITNHIRFQGQYFDEETGFHYNRHRYYSPYVGRFISKDPIGLSGGINIYAYAPNTVEWIDPLGLNNTNKYKNKQQQKAKEESCGQGRTSSQARREVMRKAGIPTSSSTPVKQRVIPGWEQYMYSVKTGAGEKIMIVSHHPADKEHPAAPAMMDNGEVRTNNQGAWKYSSGGPVVTHD